MGIAALSSELFSFDFLSLYYRAANTAAEAAISVADTRWLKIQYASFDDAAKREDRGGFADAEAAAA